MKFNAVFLAVGLGMAFAVGAFTCPTPDLPGNGSAAPEIEASTWFNHIGANPDLESLRGQAILLEFWATW
ncbi:MAG TPA: hypothetical protein EYQ59_06545 [Planctomycetes bacterium]|nr:hypothetical protein [Planctomycetota bacterium]